MNWFLDVNQLLLYCEVTEKFPFDGYFLPGYAREIKWTQERCSTTNNFIYKQFLGENTNVFSKISNKTKNPIN